MSSPNALEAQDGKSPKRQLKDTALRLLATGALLGAGSGLAVAATSADPGSGRQEGGASAPETLGVEGGASAPDTPTTARHYHVTTSGPHHHISEHRRPPAPETGGVMTAPTPDYSPSGGVAAPQQTYEAPSPAYTAPGGTPGPTTASQGGGTAAPK